MTEHNEFQLVKKIYIGMILLVFFSIMFATLTGNALGIDCTLESTNAQCKLNDITANMAVTSTKLSTSFDNWTQSPLTTIQSSLFGSGIVNYIIIYPVDAIAHTFGFFGKVLILMGYSFYVVIFIITSLVPALFASTNFGVLSGLFTTMYVFVLAIGVFYVLYLIVQRVSQIANFVKI